MCCSRDLWNPSRLQFSIEVGRVAAPFAVGGRARPSSQADSGKRYPTPYTGPDSVSLISGKRTAWIFFPPLLTSSLAARAREWCWCLSRRERTLCVYALTNSSQRCMRGNKQRALPFMEREAALCFVRWKESGTQKKCTRSEDNFSPCERFSSMAELLSLRLCTRTDPSRQLLQQTPFIWANYHDMSRTLGII